MENSLLRGENQLSVKWKTINQLEKHEEFRDKLNARARKVNERRSHETIGPVCDVTCALQRCWSFLFGLIKHIFAQYFSIVRREEKNKSEVHRVYGVLKFFIHHSAAVAGDLISKYRRISSACVIKSQKVLVAFFSPTVLRWIIQ